MDTFIDSENFVDKLLALVSEHNTADRIQQEVARPRDQA